MCDDTKPVHVRVAADLDCSGEEQWKDVPIDSCIAQIVKVLQDGGIDMRGSCCGHDRNEGHIHLQDGRALLVLSKEEADWYFREGVPLLQRRGTPRRA